MNGHLGRYLALAASMALLGFVWASPAAAAAKSTNVLLVPAASGPHGGAFPTTGYPTGYAPTFTTGALSLIESGQLAAYDTVVLVQVCNIANYLSNATFKTNLEQFVSGGGKLIIWDSECQGTSYTGFVFPFTTNNPGAMGSSSGALQDVETNTLSDTNPASASYVNLGLVAASPSDAVGDANVMVSQNQHWCVDLTATNTNNVTGPVQTYARLGSGLIIYNGLDMDILNRPGFDAASTSAQDHLGRLWLLNLLQPWTPDNLPCGVKVFGLALSPNPATASVGKGVTLTVHASISSVKQPGVVVTFTVTGGPNMGVTGTATTDANGDATFSYTGSSTAGTDTVTATATLADTSVSDTSEVVWTGAAVAEPYAPPSSYLCWNPWMVDPVAYLDSVVDDMWKTGNYLEPQAVLGNVVDGTNIGAYHLVCNAASTLKETEFAIGGSGEVYTPEAVAAYHNDHAFSGNDLNIYHIWK